MAGWDDLVMAGQPCLINYFFETTAGVDWKFKVGPFTDANDAAVDLSTATWVCKVLTEVGGTEVATWTVTGDSSGYLTGTLDDATTAGIAAARQCVWYCHGTLSGAKVMFWGPSGSPFTVKQGA